MRQKKHTQAIPGQTLQQVQDLLNQVITLLAPYTLALTPAERHALLKMGEKTLSFVEKSREFAQQNPALRPAYLNMEAFDIDLADAHGLWALQNTARQIDEIVSDTAMVAGSEAYQSALVFYASVKAAAVRNVPGAKAIYEELRKRFPGGRRSAAELTSAE